MKKYFFMTAILIFGSIAFACGGNRNPETKEKESQPVTTSQNSNAVVSPSTGNITNGNPAGRKDDLDADDARRTNMNQSSNGKAKSTENRDAADVANGNQDQKRLDRDDPEKTRDSTNRSKSPQSRRDSDDPGRRENDRDEDDN